MEKNLGCKYCVFKEYGKPLCSDTRRVLIHDPVYGEVEIFTDYCLHLNANGNCPHFVEEEDH